MVLYDFLVCFLRQNGYDIHADGDNYIVGIPDFESENYSPITLVSHIDTIARPNGVSLAQERQKVFNTKGVLGADDRAGVYTILETIRQTNKRPVVIFTNYEEGGGRGVKQLIKDKILEEFVEYIDLFIEPDRQDLNDYVYYTQTIPKELHDFAKHYGYVERSGSYSDVADLSDEYYIPHLNISVGYSGQHTAAEFLNLFGLEMTLRNVIDMLNDNNAPTIRLTEDNFRTKWNNSYYNNSYKHNGGVNNGIHVASNLVGYDSYHSDFNDLMIDIDAEPNIKKPWMNGKYLTTVNGEQLPEGFHVVVEEEEEEEDIIDTKPNGRFLNPDMESFVE